MKTLIKDYSFSASAKQVTLNNIGTTLEMEDILLITNTTDNITIYQFNDPLLGATISGNVLTLTYSTVSMSDTDSLQIWVDLPNTDFEALNTMLQDSLNEVVRQLQMIRNASGMPDQAKRVRCNVETGTVAIASNQDIRTVSTVTNLTQAGGFALQSQTMQLTNAGAQNIRNRIAVS